MMTIKPFCVKSGEITINELNEMLSKCVELGAEVYHWVEGFEVSDAQSHEIGTLKYWGVDRNLDTATHNTAPCYEGNVLTKAEAFEILGIATQDHRTKPDWRSAPSWANYLAMDKIGTWYWYENPPCIESKEPRTYYSWCVLSGKYEAADLSDIWHNSLETRPK